ncbi:hypothetical protein V8E53_011748, partial [Lactarius tabidus]
MAPRTRRSHTNGNTNSAHGIGNENVSFEGPIVTNQNNVVVQSVVPETQPQILHAARGKRTFAQAQAAGNACVSASPAVQNNPTKKVRTLGPARGHPMPLILPSEGDAESHRLPNRDSEMASQQQRVDCVVKPVRAKLECTSSFYPGRGDDSHVLACLDKANFHAPPVDDENSETDDNSMEDDNTVKFALKQPNKFSESLAIERASWAESGGSEPDNLATQGSTWSLDNAGKTLTQDAISHPFAQPGLDTVASTAGLSGAKSTSDESLFQGAQPAETDLDAIENLRAAMLFNNAFPDICIALGLIKDCLLTAANHLRPGAKEVLERLEQDHDYMLKITPLPRARICLIRSEVKERCNTITMASFLAFGSALDTI